ncbi:NRDE family protein [Microbulbifer sp. TYP-18]|uniref:NRDE family protein n=1 Tax=Microbulbifer sp. TYP-18 TaxID=3230024 RepID=UPI0034C62703
MCLLLFAYRCHTEYPLLLFANRDEYYRRPTQPAARWPDTDLVAGRDLQGGGTWAGVAPGRVAAVTNIREPLQPVPVDPLSRGDIPLAFLRHRVLPARYAATLKLSRYRGFNALLYQHGAVGELICAGNRHQPFAFTPGIHGISNGAPDAPWPKVKKGKRLIAQLLQGIDTQLSDDNFVSPGLALLQDRQPGAEAALPDTGVSKQMELALSPIFVQIGRGDLPAAYADDPSGGYGTRASTLVAVDKDGHIQFWEQSYQRGEKLAPLRHFALD